jgi:arylsulfatase A-like enzyme
MIIITSDHAQAFNEHGFMYHGVYLYDEIIRVPLVIKYPHGKKFRAVKGYQSLVSIPKLIKEIIEGGDDAALTTDNAFAESYGNMDRPPLSYKSRMDYVNNKYEKNRAAVYMNDYKLNVNGGDGVVEEFLKGTKPVDPRAREHRQAFDQLSDELQRFKKKEKFKIPGGS